MPEEIPRTRDRAAGGGIRSSRGRFCVRVAAVAVVAFRAFVPVGAAGQVGVETDRAALEALHAATDGENWTDDTNWLTDAPLGEWYGVTTDAAGRVTGLDLHDNGLTGPIPDALGRLARLENLNLYRNGLTGPIPDALGRLPSLERLGLGSNGLTGPIPDALGRLPGLRWLFLQDNGLTGPVPDALGRLPNLERLDLSYLWGVSGPLPPGLRSAVSLDRLNVFVTRACAPTAWRGWLETIRFTGRLCGSENATIDVAVVYTPAARGASGGAAAIEAVVDLMMRRPTRPCGRAGCPIASRWRAGPRCSTPRRASPGSTSAGSPTRRTATWTGCMSCATRSGPISCISSWTRTRPTWRAGPTSPAPSASPPTRGAAATSRTSWDTTWGCCTIGIRCTATKAGRARIRRTAT